MSIDDGRGRLECRFADGPLGGPNRIETAFTGASGAERRRSPSLRRRGAERDSAAQRDSAAALRRRSPDSGCGNWSTAGVPGMNPARRRRRSRATRQRGPGAARRRDELLRARADGSISVTPWPWPTRWRIVVATPDAELADRRSSRRALPRTLPLADAVFNMQHLALLLGALQSGKRGGFARGASRSGASAVSASGSCRVCAECSQCGILM